MSSGGNKATTTTTDPPAWAVPHFQGALNRASQLSQRPYEGYDGNMVAGMTGDQNLAADLIRQQATNTDVLDAGSGYVSSLLGGNGGFTAQRNQFAGENPYLGQMIANAQGDVVNQYQQATLPGLMGQFNSAGAYGGSAHQNALNQANRTLADQLSQISTGMRSEDYNRQVGLDESYLGRQQDAFGINQQGQLSALGMIPGLNQAGLMGAQALGQQGALQQANQQAQLDSNYNQFMEQRDWDVNQLQTLANMLGTVQGGSTTSPNPNYRSAGQNAMTAAMMLGSAAIMASSKELKDREGALEPEDALKAIRGLPVDRWSYKGDDTPHVGTYAESFNNSLGFPNRPYIHTVDAIGALTGAVQALDKKIGRKR